MGTGGDGMTLRKTGQAGPSPLRLSDPLMGYLRICGRETGPKFSVSQMCLMGNELSLEFLTVYA